MTSLSVIKDFDILKEIPIGIIISLPSAVINQLGFKEMKKRFSYRVIPTISFATHTLYKRALLERLGKSSASILDPSIRMDQESFGRLPSLTGVLQSLEHALMAQRLIQCPPHYFARIQIQKNRQIQPAFSRPEWSKKQGVVGLFPCFSSPNRTCTFQRIRLSIQAWPMAMATS